MTHAAPSSDDSQPDRENLVGEVTNIVNAALGVGAALTKAVAQITASGHVVSAPPSGDAPISVIIHYSAQTVTNVVGLVIANLGSVAQIRRTPPSQQSTRTEPVPAAAQPDTSAAPAGLPSVRQGATLRVPLSIENPTGDPMIDLTFVCVAMKAETRGEGARLSIDAVRFQPASIEVAPKDFEKLTIFVDTTSQTALGHYEATISTVRKTFDMTLRFEVVRASS